MSSSIISIPGNIIVLNRGDSHAFNIDLTVSDNPGEIYRLKGNDVLYFGLMYPRQEFEDAIVKKKFTVEDYYEDSDILEILLEPEDTVDLLPGKYYYAIKLKLDHIELEEDGSEKRVTGVETVVNKTKFIVCD